MWQISRGKFDRLRRTATGFTTVPLVSLMDMGFAINSSIAHDRRSLIRFLFIGSRFCSALLSGPTSRRVLFHPCASLSLHVHHVGKRTYTSLAVEPARHTKKKGKAVCFPLYLYESFCLLQRGAPNICRARIGPADHAALVGEETALAGYARGDRVGG